MSAKKCSKLLRGPKVKIYFDFKEKQ